ncbi:MAG: NAD(P)H-binding protein [Myxococcota bacterium]
MSKAQQTSPKFLILGATGKTGRRVVERLETLDIPVRRGSRNASPRFDWNDEASWDASLQGVESIYVNYAPDLAMPGAGDAIRALLERAKAHQVRNAVLLSGRGEAEAQACERIVQGSGLRWTVVRASWFNQNFDEGGFAEMVASGHVTLPAGDVPEPFVDVEDIAEVIVAALLDPERHAGEVYEVTGPQLLTFREAVSEIADASGLDLRYTQIPHDQFLSGVEASGAPSEVAWMMDYLFATVLDGRNARVTDGVQRSLGREPREFRDYARAVAQTGVWTRSPTGPV